jgi:hypothetical protein
MIALVLAAALTQAQQQKHDADEYAMYQRLQAIDEKVWQIWRPDSKLLSDQRAARRCYTNFHLQKVEGCDAEFDKVEQDLGKVKEDK